MRSPATAVAHPTAAVLSSSALFADAASAEHLPSSLWGMLCLSLYRLCSSSAGRTQFSLVDAGQTASPQPSGCGPCAAGLPDKLNRIALPLRKTLTYDRGREMAQHRQLTANTGGMYFCDPHSPWKRGRNENTNGLVRQFLPKGTDLSGYSLAQLDAIADRMNGRPRKTPDWCMPLEVYGQRLAKLQHSPDTIQ